MENDFDLEKISKLEKFDPAEYLLNKVAIAAYLTEMLADNNADLLVVALGDIARSRGMTEVAKAAGISREGLYKSLRTGSMPRLDTFLGVCSALGMRLVIEPKDS